MDKSKDEIVVVRRTAPVNLLPEAVSDDTTVVIGSKYKKGTKSVYMGIDRQERELMLPSIIEVTPTDPNWEKEVKLYFANLIISIPPEGLQLNKGMTKATRVISQKEVLVDFPIEPEDYIKYKQLLGDKSIAKSPEQAKSGTYKAYIEDLAAEKEKEVLLRKSKATVDRAYYALVDTDDKGMYSNENKIRAVFYCFGMNPDAHTIDEMIGIIETKKNSAITDISNGVEPLDTEFMRVANDPNLGTKAKIYKLIIMGDIKAVGEYFVDPNNPEKVYGKSIDQLVTYWNSDLNQADVMKWTHTLQEAKKLV